MFYTQELGPGARAIYTTTRTPGTDFAEGRHDARAALDAAVGVRTQWVSQVHSSDVIQVRGDAPGTHGRADALLVNDEPSLAPAVRTADCIPLLIASASGRVRVAVHAGRRGLVAGIIPRALRAAQSLSDEVLYVALGPHICVHCYEVSEDLARETWDAHPVMRGETQWGTPALNLTALAREQVRAAGLDLEDLPAGVDSARWCTVENRDFFSYRRDHSAQRCASLVIEGHAESLPTRGTKSAIA
ncbi:MAG: polyphenol oxidase family protein [Bowdeniella nasicola]|nr:polyphenol oxidase family protein [Bowdeniella nasicola]